MRRVQRVVVVLVLTLVFMAVLGRVQWPEAVGLVVSDLSHAIGGRGIEATEDLFLLLCLLASLMAAIAIVVLIGRRRAR